MSISYIPPAIRQCLWGKAGGRCQYPGCNRPLYRDDLTQAEFNSSYVAHIIADKPDGPRGDAVLSDQLKSDISNLMVLCDAHHRLVDIVDVAGHPVDVLREYKRKHEERIELLTEIKEDQQSHMLLYGARVGEHDSPLSYRKASVAMVPEKYPASSQPILLGLKNSSFTDADASYWSMEQEHLQRQFDRFVVPAIRDGGIQHLSVFAFAPMPLLTELGRLLSDIVIADVFQLHREPPTWKWQTEPADFHFTVQKDGNHQSKKVAMVLALSADVDTKRITSAIGNDIALWQLSHANPGNDFLRGPNQLEEFRRTLRQTLNEIKLAHGEDAELHVFPAMPISCAVELGRVWMPKADLPFLMYDQNRKMGGFLPALWIRQPEHGGNA
ncbi:SAVED domain-containing protein [Roseiconus lacunae]|uniref:SAVED domain-containing protein n=1 Tax=Roseiconus lacunae TaxID=2605694 RepID=A0ABT7PNV6_9BACT|nr:SAVED domain-containing protein [Roseiconus lacunae]MDM4018168.1 SAVED domain-containing protein [Roseiconus lacunae]